MAPQNSIIQKCMLLLIILSFFSCSKDSDLFSDALQEEMGNLDNEGEIGDNSVSFQLTDDTFTISAIETAHLFDVLFNDTIPEGSQISITDASSPQEGLLTVNDNNLFSYTPIIQSDKGNGDVVVDRFTYKVSISLNGDIYEKNATVTVTTEYSDLDAGKDMGALKAFPSAFGPGSLATGGRGRALAIINTLDPYAPLSYHSNNSGGGDEYYTGGFISALQEANVGYIVFNVSGDLHIGKGGGWYDGFTGVNNKTVFGQSAPRGGITITDKSLRFSGRQGDTKNLIFRYLRSRPIYDRNGVATSEDDAFTWGLLFYGGEDIIVDHCSLSFAQDKALGAYIDENVVANGHGLYNLTFQNNFIQDSGTGAYVEINPNRSGDPEEYVDAISWHNNVFSSVNRTPNLAFNGRAEKVNNIIHNTPSKNTSVYHSLRLNSEGNYYQRQGSSPNKVRIDVNDQTSGNPLIYTSSNVYSGRAGGLNVSLSGNSLEDNTKMWSTIDSDILAPASYFTATRHNHGFPNPVSVVSPFEAFENLVVKGDVGAYKYLDDNGYVQTYRDPFDSSQLEIVRNNSDYQPKNASNWVLPEIPQNIRPNTYDSDNDGMSDAWEIRNFGNLEQSYRGDYNNDGYTNIEEFMAQVDFD